MTETPIYTNLQVRENNANDITDELLTSWQNFLYYLVDLLEAYFKLSSICGLEIKDGGTLSPPSWARPKSPVLNRVKTLHSVREASYLQ